MTCLSLTRLPFAAAILPLLLAALMFAAPGAALADDKEERRSISVSGSGTAKARPDTAHISAGVVSERGTAAAALSDNSAAMKKVIAALKEKGLEARDIQTTNFSVNPTYTRAKRGEAPKIVGYRVVNSVRIRVRDLDKLGGILDTVVSLGSNDVGGISFSIAETDALTDQAREKAMADAKRKATLLAKAAGATLGKVMTITEGGFAPAPRRILARAAAMEAAAPIEAGEQSLRINVNVTWELE